MPKATASAAAGGLPEDLKEALLDVEVAANELMFATSIVRDLFGIIYAHKMPWPGFPGHHRLILSDLELDRFSHLVQSVEESAVRHAHAVAAIVEAVEGGRPNLQ